MADPWLRVTDILGTWFVFVEPVPFTIGSGSGTDLRLPGLSAVEAEIHGEDGIFVIRARGSRLRTLMRFGTFMPRGMFINGERHTEKALAHGDLIRLGPSGDTEIVFFIDGKSPFDLYFPSGLYLAGC